MSDLRIASANGAHVIIDESTVQTLRAALRGNLISPADAGYDEARTIFNAMIDRRPALIARCAGASDVVECVRFARARQLILSVRGTGHNVAGVSICDDGFVIDLSRMKSIRVNVADRSARVEAGATWGELNHDLQVFNLAATGGFVSTTGVAGLTLGGGLGWLVRKHGLALDNLLSVDVVTADGEFVTASADSHPDLFWALRGGGGNFGVVTSFEFRVHPAGTVLAGMVIHSIADAPAALRSWRGFESTVPDDLTNGALLFSAPPAPFLPESYHGAPVVGMGGVYTGDLATGERALQLLRAFGQPLADIFQPMPYSAAQTMADFLWPQGCLNYWKSNFLKALSDDAIDTIVHWFSKTPSALTTVVIEHNGDSAFSRVPEHETAFGHRRWPYNLVVTAMWKDPAESDANIAWIRAFWEAMRPCLADAVYVNYLGDEGLDRVRDAYGVEKYARLAALKARYDPTNLFRSNQNIRPDVVGA